MIEPRKLTRSGRWQARFHDANGVVRSGGTFATKTEAKRATADLDHSVRAGTFDDGTKGTMLFSEWAPLALELAEISTDTRYNYQHICTRDLLPFFGAMALRDITPDTVALWWKRAFAKKSRLSHYNVLRKILTMAVDSRDHRVSIPVSPCRVKPKVSQKKRELLELEDFNRLVAAASPTMKTFILLTWGASMRIGEAIGLDWKHVKGNTVRIEQQWRYRAGEGLVIDTTKNEKVRVVKLFPEAVEALAALPKGIGSTPVLTNAAGQRLSRQGLYLEWNVLREEMGLPELHIHDLRHLSLTIYAQRGATLAELMARAGHTKPDMVIQYQHVAQSREDQLVAGISVLKLALDA